MHLDLLRVNCKTTEQMLCRRTQCLNPFDLQTGWNWQKDECRCNQISWAPSDPHAAHSHPYLCPLSTCTATQQIRLALRSSSVTGKHWRSLALHTRAAGVFRFRHDHEKSAHREHHWHCAAFEKKYSFVSLQQIPGIFSIVQCFNPHCSCNDGSLPRSGHARVLYRCHFRHDEVRPCSEICGIVLRINKILVWDTAVKTSCILFPWCFVLHQTEITMRNVWQSNWQKIFP